MLVGPPVAEGKLQKLGHPARASTSNGQDSGYGSQPRLDIPEDIDEEYTAEEEVTYGSDVEDESAREGVALLWRDQEEDETISEPEETPAGSPSKHVVVIPATPSEAEDDKPSDDDDEEEEEDPEDGALVYRIPSELAEELQHRRISFSDSVRISGGIRSSAGPHRHRRPPPFADLFAPGLPPNATERTPLSLSSQAITRSASVSSVSNSRSGSPNRLFTRNFSSSSILQPIARDAYSIYSSSPTSQLQSRSSSPCSSIYAPLQAPKNHCPSPMFVRVAPKRKGSSSGISFKDYLRGRDTRSDGESDEEVFRGYRDLVDRQMRKRERWEKRKRRDEARASGKGSFWSRVGDLLAIGAGVGTRTGGVGYGATATTALGSRGRRRRARDEEERARRTRSRLSISSDGMDDDSSSSDDEEVARQSRSWTGRNSAQSQPPNVKSEVDVRFGAAPRRWTTLSWWGWKVRGWWKSLASLFAWSPLKEEAEREGVYESL